MVRSNFNKTYYFPCLSALFCKVQFKVNHSDWGDNDKQNLQINQCLIAVWDIFVASEGVDLISKLGAPQRFRWNGKLWENHTFRHCWNLNWLFHRSYACIDKKGVVLPLRLPDRTVRVWRKPLFCLAAMDNLCWNTARRQLSPMSEYRPTNDQGGGKKADIFFETRL